MYYRKLKKEDIGKEIDSKVNLNDLFYGFYDNSVENDDEVIKVEYGDLIGQDK